MTFDTFQSIIENLRSIPLGGEKAQFKLAPALRLNYDRERIVANNPKRAAVLALVYPNKEKEAVFLLTERASYKGTHSAQISFPGGKIEEKDADLTATALRETQEEVGIQSKEVKLIREITDVYIPPSNFLVTPFLAYTESQPNFLINHEVAAILEVPVRELMNDDNIETVMMTTSYMKNYPVPSFSFHNQIVWGATGMMLSEIREMIKTVTF